MNDILTSWMGEPMRRGFLTLGVVALLVLATSSDGRADGYEITFDYSGDNVIGAAYQNGAGPTFYDTSAETNAMEWRAADSLTITGLHWDTDYDFMFLVRNSYTTDAWIDDGEEVAAGSGNPAAFIADVTGTGLSLVTDDEGAWMVSTNFTQNSLDVTFDANGFLTSTSLPAGWDFDDASMAWTTATSEGVKSVGPWNGDTKAGLDSISSTAEWLWTDNNFAVDQDHMAWIKLTVTTPVPEPASLLLFGVGAAGVAVARRRRRRD